MMMKKWIEKLENDSGSINHHINFQTFEKNNSSVWVFFKLFALRP